MKRLYEILTRFESFGDLTTQTLDWYDLAGNRIGTIPMTWGNK